MSWQHEAGEKSKTVAIMRMSSRQRYMAKKLINFLGLFDKLNQGEAPVMVTFSASRQATYHISEIFKHKMKCRLELESLYR